MDEEVTVALWKHLQERGLVQRGLRIVPDYTLPYDRPVAIAFDTDLAIVFYLPTYFSGLNELDKALVTAHAVRHDVTHLIYPRHTEEAVKHLTKGIISDDQVQALVQGVLMRRKGRRPGFVSMAEELVSSVEEAFPRIRNLRRILGIPTPASRYSRWFPPSHPL